MLGPSLFSEFCFTSRGGICLGNNLAASKRSCEAAVVENALRNAALADQLRVLDGCWVLGAHLKSSPG